MLSAYEGRITIIYRFLYYVWRGRGIWMNGEGLCNTEGLGGGGGGRYQPLSLLSMIFITVVGLMYVYMYMKMIILYGSFRCDGGQQCGSCNDAQLEQYLLHLRPNFFAVACVCRLRPCVYDQTLYSWLLRIVRDVASHTAETFFAACCSPL